MQNSANLSSNRRFCLAIQNSEEKWGFLDSFQKSQEEIANCCMALPKATQESEFLRSFGESHAGIFDSCIAFAKSAQQLRIL